MASRLVHLCYATLRLRCALLLERVCFQLLGSMVSLVTTQITISWESFSMLRQLLVQGAPPIVRVLHAHPGQNQVVHVQRELKWQEVVVVLNNAAIWTGNQTPNLWHQLSKRHAPRLIVILSMIRPSHSSAEAQTPQIPSDTTLPFVQANKG